MTISIEHYDYLTTFTLLYATYQFFSRWSEVNINGGDEVDSKPQDILTKLEEILVKLGTYHFLYNIR